MCNVCVICAAAYTPLAGCSKSYRDPLISTSGVVVIGCTTMTPKAAAACAAALWLIAVTSSGSNAQLVG